MFCVVFLLVTISIVYPRAQWGYRYGIPPLEKRLGDEIPSQNSHHHTIIRGYLVNPDGSVILIGTYFGSSAVGAPSFPVLAKISKDGEVLWSKKFGWDPLGNDQRREIYPNLRMKSHFNKYLSKHIPTPPPFLLQDGPDFLLTGVFTYEEIPATVQPRDRSNGYISTPTKGLVKEYLYAAKIRGDGEIIWTKAFWNENFQHNSTAMRERERKSDSYGAYSDYDCCEYLQVHSSGTSDGSYITISHKSWFDHENSKCLTHALITKFGANGEILWNKLFKDAEIFGFEERAGTYYFLGEGIESNNHLNVVILKITPQDGSVQGILGLVNDMGDSGGSIKRRFSRENQRPDLHVLGDGTILLFKYDYCNADVVIVSNSGTIEGESVAVSIRGAKCPRFSLVKPLSTESDTQSTRFFLHAVWESLRENHEMNKNSVGGVFVCEIERLESGKTRVSIVAEKFFERSDAAKDGGILRKKTRVDSRHYRALGGFFWPGEKNDLLDQGKVFLQYEDEFRSKGEVVIAQSYWRERGKLIYRDTKVFRQRKQDIFMKVDFSKEEGGHCEVRNHKNNEEFILQRGIVASGHWLKAYPVDLSEFEFEETVELEELEGKEKEFLDDWFGAARDLEYRKEEEVCGPEEDYVGEELGRDRVDPVPSFFWVLVVMIVFVVLLFGVVIVVWFVRRVKKGNEGEEVEEEMDISGSEDLEDSTLEESSITESSMESSDDV